ncbi:MAG: hypothetical protein KDA86_20060 [Planctomycetaceae bacterium]|nr:hypothetical protein [Planctomycetaceae bacterium]
MVQRLICCLSVLCVSVTSAFGSDRSTDTAPPAPPMATIAPHAITPAPLPLESSALSPVEHLRRAADHLDAAAVGDLSEDFKKEAQRFRKTADEIEREVESQLGVLRAELKTIQQTIRELEQFTHSTDQIQVNLQIIEVDVTTAQQMGLDLGFLSKTEPNLNGSTIQLASGTFGNRAMFELDRHEELSSWISNLVDKGAAKVLAEPRLVTTSGRPATLHSGGEFPILIPKEVGEVNVKWREFGVRAEILPIILENGRVKLDVAPEVSERDFTNSVAIEGTVVPGISTRRVNTQVEMSFGQTLVIGGLVSKSREKIQVPPILSKIPELSQLFRETGESNQEREKHLLVFVTPSLVKNSAD